MHNGVQADSPEARAIVQRQIVKERAQAHDLLDTYGVPRYHPKDMKDGGYDWLDLPRRIEWFAQQGRDLFTPTERVSERLVAPSSDKEPRA